MTRYHRRELLRTTVLAATSVTLLQACSRDADSSEEAAPAGGARPSDTALRTTPAEESGGTARAAFVGAGAAETLDIFASGTTLDVVRARALHATLGNLDPGTPGGVAYGVLDAIEAADDLSTYTLRVRPDVAFSDGSALGAADVLHSLRLAAREGIASFTLFAADFDLDAAEVSDDLTLVLPTTRPIGDGAVVLCLGTNFVVKDGIEEFTEDMPTSGPFLLQSFDPGVGTNLVRNGDYYGRASGGGPYLDALELRSIADSTARLNALTGGQIDLAHDLSPLQGQTAAGDDRLVLDGSASPYLSALYFQLNMAIPPFDDVRVRQAFRLACDRQAMLDTVLFGQGELGNDLYSLGFDDYATDIPQRTHDPEGAMRLLAEAGAEGLSVTLRTGPESAGMVEAAVLYAEQLGQVGVDVTIEELPAGQLFADFEGYVAAPFVAGFSTAVPALLYYQVVFFGGGPFALGWNRPEVDELVLQARATADPGQRRQRAAEVQQVLFDEGNVILPVFKPVLTARVPGLTGVEDGLFVQYPSFTEVRVT